MEKQFEDRYTLDKSFKDLGGEDGTVETFRPHVNSLINVNPKKIWTVVDDDEGKGLFIVAGMHFVNRLFYVVTNEEWHHSDEDYIY